MPDPRVERVIALFDAALELPRSERVAFLQRECAADSELLREVQSLLDTHESQDSSFDDLAKAVVSPALGVVLGALDRSHGHAVRAELESALADRYRILKELGGGMSHVFVAIETRLARRVVIKVLPPERGGRESAERFRREIALAAQLQHPHIVPLLASDAAGSLLYYTMPFISGETLRDRLTRTGRVTVPDAIALWRDVLEALGHAHANGVIHGDVKPENILLSGENALVSDFGVARALLPSDEEAATAEARVMGTPTYMAPEQLLSAHVDHRADLFAAGLVMQEMLEGRLPLAVDAPRDAIMARLTSDSPPVRCADCPDALVRLVSQCLARAPADRPASATAVLAELDRIERHVDASAGGRRSAWRAPRWAVAAALIAVLALGAWAVVTGRAGSSRPVDSTPAIAVMPIANLSADPADAALAEGMTEELTARLARSGQIRVAGTTSVLALRERRLNVRQIAESLGVSHVVEGAFQKSGSRMRWQIRLVDASDGSSRWSETYDREIGDIFAVQDDIARAVSDELNVRLRPAERARANRRYTPPIAAWEWYQRGRSIELLRTSEGRRKAIEYFNKAIAEDSSFADAHAGLVFVYNNVAGTARGDHNEWFTRAERSARRALQLDSSLAAGYSALGWARLHTGDWAGVENAFMRALELDPMVHRGHEGLARLYMLMGRAAEQLAAARRGLEADPYSHAAIREMALALSVNGRCDEAIEVLRPLKSLDPPAGVAGVITGICHLKKRMWTEARDEFRWSMETNEARSALAFLGYALARSGQRTEAERILDDLEAGRRDSHGAFGIAIVHAGLGNLDDAFVWLERSVHENSWRVYIMDPLFDELHRDPRFARLGVFGARAGIRR